MNNNTWQYEKGNLELPDRESLQPLHNTDVEADIDLDGGYLQSIPNYSKQEGMLSQSLVYVISGGSETEKSFFKELILNRRITSVHVIFESKQNQGLQPYQMNDKWQKARSEGFINVEQMNYTLASVDKVYLVTDLDEFEDQLVKILANKVDDDNAKWIISNPCFEIWLYYCYSDGFATDLDELESVDVAHRSQRLSTICHEKLEGRMNPVKAFEFIQDGILRSKVSYKEKTSGIPELCCTQMYILAEYLLDVMERKNGEFAHFLAVKKAEIDYYRSLNGTANEFNYV